jgi:hypothetical protein
LLNKFAKALATSAYNDDVMESMAEKNKKSPQVATILSRINAAKADKSVTVQLPVLKITSMTVRVAKATVSKSTSLPDPYLFAVKAVVNWFAG